MAEPVYEKRKALVETEKGPIEAIFYVYLNHSNMLESDWDIEHFLNTYVANLNRK